MSSGGARGIDVSGITSLRIQSASDATTRLRLQELYLNFASTTGANAWRNRTPNGYGYFLDFTMGRKEGCASCTGLPYQFTNVLNFRNA
jgi:hypothetical protein